MDILEYLENGKFRFEEMCDEYYEIELTKEQLLGLADEIIELAEKKR